MHGGVNGERRTPAQRAEEEARLEGLRRIKATKPEETTAGGGEGEVVLLTIGDFPSEAAGTVRRMCGDGVGGAPSTLTANASAWGASAWGAEDALVSRAHGAGGAEDGGKSKEEFGWNSVLRKKVQAKLLRRTFAPYGAVYLSLCTDTLGRWKPADGMVVCFLSKAQADSAIEAIKTVGGLTILPGVGNHILDFKLQFLGSGRFDQDKWKQVVSESTPRDGARRGKVAAGRVKQQALR